MNNQTLCWAVFVAVLCPLMLASPEQPLFVTCMQIAMCLGLVALADSIERRPR